VKGVWKSHEVSVEAVFIANTPNTFVTNRVDEINLDYGGIPGDLHFGLTKKSGVRESMYPRGTEIFNRRQITIVSVEECAMIAEKLGVEKVLPEWLGANIVLSGFPNLTQLPAGSRIVFASGAGLLCEGENLPCTQPGEIIQNVYQEIPKLTTKFVRVAYGQRGIVCVVERPGKVETGDSARVVVYDPPKIN
jgi:MOSC domain-containing protein YiiM